MNRLSAMIFVGFTVGFVMLVPLTLVWKMAEAQNTTFPKNTTNTRMVLNLKDKTITMINMTTNETINTRNITTPSGNVTLSEHAGNITTNETPAIESQNQTTKENLTTRLNALQGK